MKTRRFSSSILTLAGLALASSAFAQYASPNPSPSPSTGSTSGTTSGTTGSTTTPRSSTTTGTTYDLRDAEIIAVQGNEIVVKSSDGYRQYTVAPDYKFTVNGQPMAMAQLKPGMKMTAQIQTTKPMVTLTTTEMRNAEVVSADGMSVVVKDQTGQQRTFSDREFKGMDIVLMKDGRVVNPTDLKQGDRVTAVMLAEGPASASGSAFTPSESTPGTTGSTARTGSTGTTGTPGTTGSTATPDRYGSTGSTGTTDRAGATASPSPSREESRDVASSQRYGEDTSTDERNLPKTASPWPLVGLAGLLLVSIGGAVTLVRRFYVG